MKAKFRKKSKETSQDEKMWITRIANGCLDLLFPPSCASCDMRLDNLDPSEICDQCTAEINSLCPPLCRICGLEVHGEKDIQPLCGDCLRTPPPFSVCRSIVRYEPVVQRLVHRLKYNGDTSVLPGISQLINRHDLSNFTDCDYIIPVPLHLGRLRQRGMNQAMLLARLFFSDRPELIRTDILVRVKATIPQTKLDGVLRRKNLKGAFQIQRESDVAGAVVCLVDDVFTTGTTVRECSNMLMKSGAQKVKVLTLARAAAPHRGRQ